MGTRTRTKERRAQANTAPAPVTPSKPAWWERSRTAYAVASFVVLVPCFWHSRIQAGDLGSHIYNAWLAELIGKGQAPGLTVAAQSTNVLFDWLLSGLLNACGAGAAQRIAVSAAVLVFFWGAFALVAAVGRRAWDVAPVLAVLAYGWVFHAGFFNFYLSLGLCFWALALAWGARERLRLAAIPLLGLAYVAHALPVGWAVAVLAYVWAWRRLAPRRRLVLLAGCIAGMAAARFILAARFRTSWDAGQLWHISGADQLYVFGERYVWLAWALLAIWTWIAVDRRRALREAGLLLPVALVTAAGIFILPSVIWLPRYQHQLAFIANRMSLPVGIIICAILTGAILRPWQRRAVAGLALLFFAFLYTDEGALNDFEDQLDETVAQLPQGQRVVLSVDAPGLQVNALTHMMDRACIGRCWSYANYEPSSGQFRIRVAGPTSIVAPTDLESGLLQLGLYKVKASDPPLVQIVAGNSGRLVVRTPPAGQFIGMTAWHGL